VTIEAGGPLLATTAISFSSATVATGGYLLTTGATNAHFMPAGSLSSGGASVDYTVVALDDNNGKFQILTGNGGSATWTNMVVGSTFTAGDLGTKVRYLPGATLGDDFITVKAAKGTSGGFAIGTLVIDHTGAATYQVLPGDPEVRLSPQALFNEPSLDFSHIPQLPGLPKPAVASGDWQAEVRALLTPADPLQPANLEQAVLTRVLAQTTGHTPSLFTTAPEAVAVVPQAAQAMDTLGGLGNAYTQLLDHAGYTLQ
jgi:hypothetical protein